MSQEIRSGTEIMIEMIVDIGAGRVVIGMVETDLMIEKIETGREVDCREADLVVIEDLREETRPLLGEPAGRLRLN